MLGRHFQIKTDHDSLKFLLDQKSNIPAQHMWVIKMMGYDYELVFRKGAHNRVADALSRLPQVSLQAVTLCSNDILQRIKHSWLSDYALVHKIHKVQHSSSHAGKYSWQSGMLRRKGKLVVGSDSELRKDLLKYFHSSSEGGHSGIDATTKRIATVVYWKGLKKTVRNFIRECEICQKCKPDLSAYPGLL